MTTKQRDVVFQRWSGVIRREIQDRASLEHVGARAVSDPDVRDDATLQSMIRGELEQRRGKLEQELRSQGSAKTRAEPRPTSRSELPVPVPVPPTTPEKTREAFNRLSQTLCTSLERGDDGETIAAMEKLRILQKESLGVIPATAVAECQRRVEELRTHLQHLRDQIAALSQQSVQASRNGDERDLARAMRHLLAVHAAHPILLDEAGLDEIRADVVRASNERRDHQATTRKLLKRERAIAAEIKKLAAAVHAFHRVARTVPDTSDEFRHAEAAYLRTIQRVRAYDTEWFSGVVLELADLLAEWTLPPLEADGQIARFLDGVQRGVECIRSEMREIESEQDSREAGTRAPAAP